MTSWNHWIAQNSRIPTVDSSEKVVLHPETHKKKRKDRKREKGKKKEKKKRKKKRKEEKEKKERTLAGFSIAELNFLKIAS
jgi:hypothetical protein